MDYIKPIMANAAITNKRLKIRGDQIVRQWMSAGKGRTPD
jgi:hypothetical protein